MTANWCEEFLQDTNYKCEKLRTVEFVQIIIIVSYVKFMNDMIFKMHLPGLSCG